MRKYIIHFLLFICANISAYSQSEKSTIYLADPTIFLHEGTYYLYGTGGGLDSGFLVYTSQDLQNWSGPKGVSDGYALKKGDTFGSQGFWAPQVFNYKKTFHMAYTADEFIAIASSDSPLGPFCQKKINKLPAETRQIDPYVFFDDDGKIYLYHVRLTNGNHLFVAEMNEDLSAIKEETLTECITSVDKWENTHDSDWPVAEGPTIIKHKGLYYFFYSSNDFCNIDYAVGYAVSGSPYGPWQKYEGNPIINREMLHHNGTGHGDLFTDKENNLRYVFHTHYSNKEVAPRKTAIITMKMKEQDGKVSFEAIPETFYYPQLVNNK